MVDPTQIQLDFTSQQYVQYKLEVARNSNAPFQFLQTVYNANTVTIANLKTETEYYCFRLGAYDPCNNTTTYSNTICSADVDLNIQNNVNALSWRTSQSGLIPNAGFELFRDGVAYPSMPSTAMTFNDVDVVCNTNYCYQLINHYVNGSTSYSLPMCGKAFSTTTPTAIQDVTTAIDGSTVAITWLQDPAFAAADYRISKSVDGSPFVPVMTSAAPTVVDPNYLNGTPTCYSINYTDLCGNASAPGSEACVITLAAALQPDNVVNLSWNAYEGWKNGVKNYTVERYSASGTLLQSYSTGTTNMFVDNAPDVTNQIYVYVITAEGNDANLGFSISNAVTVIKDPNLFYPSAFTPHNRDGLNDLFVVFGQYITEFNMKIFNRWGELMFTTTDITAGWDGRYKGLPMPEDTYVFVATLTDFSGRTFNRSGSVLLLNKE